MITESSMYWLTRMDYICHALVVILAISGFTIGIVSFAIAMTYNSYEEKANAVCKHVIIPAFIVLILASVGRIFTPTTKELAVIKVVPAIANNETLREDAGELYTLAKEWLKDTLKVETKPVVEKPEKKQQTP